MMSLVAAATFFLFIHLGISGTRLRDRFVSSMGEGAYMGLFSLASLGGIIWLSMAYNAASADAYIQTWGQRYELAPVAFVMIFLGFAIGVPGLLSRSPTAAKGEDTLDRPDVVSGPLRITRNPFLWGIALWALAHLIVNGDLVALIFFGTFFVLTVAGAYSIDHKRRRALGEKWDAFTAQTSNLPFAAILTGKTGFRIGEFGWWRIVVALAVFGGLFHAHQYLFGVSPLPGWF
jgi:uncharacterized membrane protein